MPHVASGPEDKHGWKAVYSFLLQKTAENVLSKCAHSKLHLQIIGLFASHLSFCLNKPKSFEV